MQEITTLRNSFHNTEYRTTKTREDLEAIEYRIMRGNATDADRAYRRKVWKTLCGIAECKCGDTFGIR